MGNTWGRLFRVTTRGESHGPPSAPSSTAAGRGCRRRLMGVASACLSNTPERMFKVSDFLRWLTSALCPDLAERMNAALAAIRKDGDSLGRVVTCAVGGCPPGWGEASGDAS
jgi:chorismate synthase